MKIQFYPSATMLLFSFLLSINISTAGSLTPPTGSTPATGTTDFNSFYSGSFIDLTGVQSAGGAGLLAPNVAGYNFRLHASSGAVNCGIGIEPFTGETALVYGFTQSGLTNLTALEISSNDGKFFDLHSLDITIDGLSSGTSKDVQLVGYRSGSPIPGAVLVKAVTAASNGGVLVNFDVTANTNFTGVDMFRVETDGSYTISGAIGVDNINAVNFRGLLPITLISYNAAVENNTAVLNWRMVSELNSSNFVIEKSSDGINFTVIGSVVSKADFIGVAENVFIDEHPFYGNNYYRIKLIDVMEEERYLGVRKLTFAYKSNVTVFPNPVSGSSITLQTGDAKNVKQLYTITDMAGNTVGNGAVTNYLQPIDVSRIISGVYMLHLTNGTNIKFQKQ